MNAAKLHIVLLLLLLSVATGCRRDLLVYTDEFSHTELTTDWSMATGQPSGMTWWMMKDDHSGDYHNTTADVTHCKIGVPRGVYSGVVFDYSPDEYSHQEFVGMDHIDNALVHLLPSADQPEPDEELYGPEAVMDQAKAIPIYEPTGMYMVTAEPEIMNADTLHHINIESGLSDDLIPWDEAEKYATDVDEVQMLTACPKPIVWKLNITVYVEGVTFMNNVVASVTGLADGYWLGKLRHTSTPCLQILDNWSRQRTSAEGHEDVGILTTSINTFGLQDLDMPPSPYDARYTSTTKAADEKPEWSKHLRLNLKFNLRDKETIIYEHYDIDSEWITINEGSLLVNIQVPVDVAPVLPEVEDAGTTGFGAEVTPWSDGDTTDQTM